MTAIIFFLVAFAACTIGAVSGIGGGIIIKPVLGLFPGHTVEEISFLSGCTVLAMSLVSKLLTKNTGDRGDRRSETFLAVGGAAGGVLGKLLFDRVSAGFGGNSLGVVQAVILLAMVVALLVYMRLKDKLPQRRMQSPGACAGLGLALGLMSSFLGIGGGPFNLAALTYFLSMETKRAASSSLYIILLSQTASLLLTVLRRNVPEFSVPILLLLICGGVLGALAGRAASRRMDNRGVEKAYTGVLVAVLLICIGNIYGYMA